MTTDPNDVPLDPQQVTAQAEQEASRQSSSFSDAGDVLSGLGDVAELALSLGSAAAKNTATVVEATGGVIAGVIGGIFEGL